MSAILAWLTARVGSFLGPILYYVLEKLLGKFIAWAKLKIATYVERRERAKRQKEAQEKLEQDIQSGAPRTEETRKNEEDWINS